MLILADRILIRNNYVNYPSKRKNDRQLSSGLTIDRATGLWKPHCEFCSWPLSRFWISHSTCLYLYSCPFCKTEIILHTYQRWILGSLLKMCKTFPDPLMKSSVIGYSLKGARGGGRENTLGVSVEASSEISHHHHQP